MNISQEKKDNLNAVITINLDAVDYAPRVEKAIKDQAKKANIPGFRKGMVPTGHIKRMYGKSILVEEINSMLSDTLNNYLNEQQLEVLGQPLPVEDGAKDYNWDFTDNFVFNYEVGLAPNFALDITSKDKVTKYDIKVDDETLNARIKNLRRSYGKMSNPDVSAEDDVLYGVLKQLSPDGSVFEGGIEHTGSVRLDQVQDAAIQKSLVGLKKDDVVNLDVQKAYNNDAARIAAILGIDEETAAELKSNFSLTVKNVNRLGEADLDQEFFDKLFGEGVVTTEEEFRNKVKEEVEAMMTQDSERKVQTDIFNYVVGKVNFELPDEFLKRWLKVTNGKLTEEELQGGYDDFAKNLRWTLVGNKIMKDNDIKVEYSEVFEAAKARLDAQFRMYSPQPLADDQLAQYTVQFLQNKENANRIFDEVKGAKVIENLKGLMTVDNKEISATEFAKVS
ncbi:trigger factor [Mucilaginibacter myungsuensis]|uniref:Trigger factor n=1 Tax=Mucilaginibacter myungsuensis TaxID=649104 RepID=A0A929KY76_9SPHI|nr:trigger factor [Mucilaginibacter myungsuensis]MBE9662710.1 trigger factor [Mucilaginibacter myungsuensis]MDN3598130.1 trigger factor [Mucilaginibacter myungsuensis]